jgi:hypothetical protein
MAVIKVLKDGFTDIDSNDISDFALHSDYKCQKIASNDSVNLSMVNTDYASGVIYHNLGYIPAFYVFVEYDGKGFEAYGNNNPTITVPAQGGGTTRVTFNINADSSKLNIEAWASFIWGNVANSTFTIRVFFVLDEIV